MKAAAATSVLAGTAAVLLTGCGGGGKPAASSAPPASTGPAAATPAPPTASIVAYDPVNVLRRAQGCEIPPEETRGRLPFGGGPALYATCTYPSGDSLAVWGYPSHAVMVADLKINVPSREVGKTIMLGDTFLAELRSSPYGPKPAVVAAQIGGVIS